MNKRILSICIFLSISTFLIGCTGSVVREAVNQAEAAAKEHKYEQARTILELQLQKYPYSQPLLIEKAQIQRLQHDYTGFLEVRPRLSPKTLRASPEFTRYQLIALIKTNKFAEAAQLVDSQLAQDRSNADRLQLKGQLAYLQEDLDGAITLYDQALEQDPTNTDALVNKAVALADQGHLLESLELLDNALQLAPDNYLIRYNKGTVLSDLGFQQKSLVATGAFSYFSDALRHFEKAYTLEPTSTDTLIRLGITYLDLGNTEKAHSALEVALSQNDQLADARYYQGKTYLAENKPEEAITTFQHLLQLAPGYELAQQELIELGTGDELPQS